MKKCATKYCRREANSRFCYQCERDNKKRNNPYAYWLGVNRRNAKRRGKHWNISFEYWVRWCDETGYLVLKGRNKNSMSIDCVKWELGYVDGNLAPLTTGDNSRKGRKNVTWNYITQTWDIIDAAQTEPYTDQPF